MKTLLVLLVLLAVCVGCEQPLTKVPLGTPWKDHEVAKLSDAWLLPGLGMPIHLAAKKNGQCLAGMVVSEPDSQTPRENNLKLVRIDCVFTRIGKYEFVFYKGIETEEDKKQAEINQTPAPDGYCFMYIVKRDDNHITLAVPTKEFGTLVQNGRLPGEIKKVKKSSYPLINTDEKTFLEVIESIGFDKCFDLQTADTAERIKPKTATSKK